MSVGPQLFSEIMTTYITIHAFIKPRHSLLECIDIYITIMIVKNNNNEKIATGKEFNIKGTSLVSIKIIFILLKNANKSLYGY